MVKWLERFRKYKFFASWLVHNDAKQAVLGYPTRPLSLEEKLSEIAKIKTHTRTTDYQSWEQEAWDQAAKLITHLSDPTADPKTIDFCRGALSQTFGLLRIGRELDNKAKMLEAERSKTKPLGMTRHPLTPTART